VLDFLTPFGNSARVSGLHADERELLTTLLKEVSRSFYLTLRVLPRKVRSQIGLAYLLARATDTVADTELIPVEQRLKSLEQLRERISGASSTPLNFGKLAQQQSLPAERVLLEKVEAGLSLLENCSAVDRKLIRTVLEIITSGQELDLKRFGAAPKPTGGGTSNAIALQAEAELDDYTYRVAGCVGEFWTEMCIEHLFRLPELEDLMWSSEFKNLGVRFGKGLQLVNILRDLPSDLRKGRCYLPADELRKIGLAPADLLQTENETRLRPLYNRYLDLAESHLKAGWEYTNRIPFTWMNLRLACAWPILIGVKTIQRLRSGNVLDPGRRIKISRNEVYTVMFKSVALYPFPGIWRKQFFTKS
jgi:farnesyl-diphosphate farnesyltransferase